jgi:ribosome biogenesis GTPase / thiamine phosphate phosphatase
VTSSSSSDPPTPDRSHPDRAPLPGGPRTTLTALGWDDTWAEDFAPQAARGLAPARLARVHRGGCELLAAAGPVRASLGPDVLERLASGASDPCTGDWVATGTWADGRVTVEAVLPRRATLTRAAASGHSRGQPLAANVDAALVVASLTAEPDLGRLERLLTLAWNGGVTPVVVLTKADLVDDAALVAEEYGTAAPGVDVLAVSAVADDGVPALSPYVGEGRTVALLGQSGVGKSTLLNALAGAPVAATSPLGDNHKGRHTTVVRDLVPLPGGGVVVDTPGLRAVGLPDVGDGLERVFADLEALAEGCRFRDCAHDTEPGCAVRTAIESGDLPERRLVSWRKLQREAEYVASRTDARRRAETRRRWKSVHRTYRAPGLHRPR